MSKALEQLKGREKTTIDNLVHCFIAYDMDKNLEGFQGYFAHYMKTAATAAARRQWEAFQARIPEVRKDMAQLMEEGMEKEGQTHGA